MSTLIANPLQLEQVINSIIENAVAYVTNIARDELESYILEDYYRQYSPKFYERTYAFLKSATQRMLSSNSAEVFVNTDVMHYLCGEYGISGHDIAYLASLGFHGTINIFRPGYYWEDFINWAQNNIPQLLKNELKKQGLSIK